jgi:hypothetical protein
MPVSVHGVVLSIEQLFTVTDDRLPASQLTASRRDWSEKQQKHTDKSSETGNVRYQRERSQNGKTSGHRISYKLQPGNKPFSASEWRF